MNDPLVRKAIARLRRREIGGLETLVEVYQLRAVRAAYLITTDRAQAEDIVQTAFLQAAAKIHQYDDRRPFEPWFMRIVVNFALQAARKSFRETSLDAPLFVDTTWTLADLIADDQPLPNEVHEQNELRAAVRAALETLPPDQRAAVVMRYYLDMSEQEMVDALNVPRGTIKWRLHEARRQLRELLDVFQFVQWNREKDTAYDG